MVKKFFPENSYFENKKGVETEQTIKTIFDLTAGWYFRFNLKTSCINVKLYCILVFLPIYIEAKIKLISEYEQNFSCIKSLDWLFNVL